MNLNLWMVDPAKLKGVWWDLLANTPCPGNVPHKERTCFKIVPHSVALDAAELAGMQPYVAIRLRGGKLDEPTARSIRGKAVAETTLVDWVNVEMGTPPAPVAYSVEQAERFMTDPVWENLRRRIELWIHNETSLLADAEQTASGN